jgi:polyphenol oxidase
MFQPRQHEGKIVGFEGRTKEALFFFGTKHCDREMLHQLFPQMTFCFLKQVHGTEVTRANPLESPEADGHFTRDRNHAAVIQTADCVPILFSSPRQVMAIHAGWRGLASHILRMAARQGSFNIAAIGPHIRAESFEVGIDVANQLKLSTPAQVILPHPQPDKRKVDLSKIAETQIRSYFYREIQIEARPDDTFTSDLFYSYRRGKDKAERQLSFVALV